MPRPDLPTYINAALPGLNLPGPRQYELNVNNIKTALSNSAFIRGLVVQLQSMATEYLPERPTLLFAHKIEELELLGKSFDSLVNRIYRENVLNNRRYPNPPDDGWVDGSNFYRRVHDIVRSRVVCRYIDGPKFVCDRLKSFCDGLGVHSSFYPVSTERGYYGWHFYCRHPIEIFAGGGVVTEQIAFELQITTQLVEVLDALTHGLYEADRLLPRGPQDNSWRWEPNTQRFRSAYLGHTLHLMEAVILSLKDEVTKPNTEAAPAANTELPGKLQEEANGH